MKIIVTGSLGHIGKPLTQQLVQEGHEVTVISTSENRRAAIRELGAKAAIGFIADVSFLIRTFTDADAVYIMTPPDMSKMDMIEYQAESGRDYARAIKASGVKRVVYLSSIGAHRESGTGIIIGKYRAEHILANELPAVSITALRPAYFYYNLENYIGLIRQGFIATNYGETPLPMAATEDVAKVIAEELTRPATPGMHVRYVVSDERTGAEIAAVLGKAIDNPDLQWMLLSDEESLLGMEAAGVPSPLAEQLNEMYTGLHNGAIDEHNHANRPAQMGKTKLEDFAKDFAASYYNALEEAY